MSKTIITKKELHVPVGAMLKVADVLNENEIANDIIGTDSDEDTRILEVQYKNEQREITYEKKMRSKSVSIAAHKASNNALFAAFLPA